VEVMDNLRILAQGAGTFWRLSQHPAGDSSRKRRGDVRSRLQSRLGAADASEWPRLTNGAARGRVRSGENLKIGAFASISRAELLPVHAG